MESPEEKIETKHRLLLEDSRKFNLDDNSIHLVLTSPPYFDLKEYEANDNQLGNLHDFEDFLEQLNKVWRESFRVLVPGGRLVVVVGDVLRSRKEHGRHFVIPLHAAIQVNCTKLGFDNLSPIIWYKIGNAKYEMERSSTFLGKPYEPNAIIKNDIEYILMFRKPGGYRSPTEQQRNRSRIPKEEFSKFFQQIWSDIPGARVKGHPAPYPEELVKRLIRMFSFVDNTILDPFVGSGTSILGAMKTGRNSIGIDVEQKYLEIARQRMSKECQAMNVEDKGKEEQSSTDFFLCSKTQLYTPAVTKESSEETPKENPKDNTQKTIKGNVKKRKKTTPEDDDADYHPKNSKI